MSHETPSYPALAPPQVEAGAAAEPQKLSHAQREMLADLLSRASVGPHELGGSREESAGDYCPVFTTETEVYPGPDCDEAGPLAIFTRRVDAALFAVSQAYFTRLLAENAALRAALEVEKAKTALLWPVATKQTPAQ